jgi:hypothetical protein
VGDMKELNVPKRGFEAEVQFVGGERLSLLLFVAESAQDHAGPERVSDLLCQGPAFLPARDPITGKTCFIARAAISVVRLARGAEPGDADELTIPTEHEVEIVLRDGTTVQGTLSYVLPAERSRLNDFLNEAPPFFRLFTSTAEVLLVNRGHVARVLFAAH